MGHSCHNQLCSLWFILTLMKCFLRKKKKSLFCQYCLPSRFKEKNLFFKCPWRFKNVFSFKSEQKIKYWHTRWSTRYSLFNLHNILFKLLMFSNCIFRVCIHLKFIARPSSVKSWPIYFFIALQPGPIRKASNHCCLKPDTFCGVCVCARSQMKPTDFSGTCCQVNVCS